MVLKEEQGTVDNEDWWREKNDDEQASASELVRIGKLLPYYPFKGIDRFYDISGVLADPEAFLVCIGHFSRRYRSIGVDAVVGIDARGFVFGPPVALTLKRPFFMIRKNGKMPNVIQSTPYTKEYKDTNSGVGDMLCMSRNAIKPGMRILIVDDVIATGGTMMTAVNLVKTQGGTVVEVACLIEIKALCGASNIKEAHPEVKCWSLLSESHLQTKG